MTDFHKIFSDVKLTDRNTLRAEIFEHFLQLSDTNFRFMRPCIINVGEERTNG